MEELRQLLETQLDKGLTQIMISSPRSGQEATKIKIRPVLLREQLYFQTQQTIGPKVFHENWKKDELITRKAGQCLPRPW